MGELEVESMAIALGAIITVSLALTQALGGLLMYLVEALKATGKVKDGYSGLVALIVGIVLGAALGLLTDAVADESMAAGTLMGLGGFAGALMAAGAIKTYKAVGEVNQGAGNAFVLGTIERDGPDELEQSFGPESAINPETAMATQDELDNMYATQTFQAPPLRE